MRVGITGQNGFIGYHLTQTIKYQYSDYTLAFFQKSFFQEENTLAEFVSSCDVIVHLAGVTTTSLLFKKYFLLKIKSFFWKVQGVVLVYFIFYFFITYGFLFIESGRFLRARRTEFVERGTFFLTFVISGIIASIIKSEK